MRAVVLVPQLKQQRDHREATATAPLRSMEAKLEEAKGLALAIDLTVTQGLIVPVSQPRPATLFGTGKIEEIGHLLDETDAGLVIVDHPLTPVQQRNLEKQWNSKVIDRTGLILEIFGRRASTKEGTLQVDLAHLNYQKGRLVRSWTHLERQRGGAGFMGVRVKRRSKRIDVFSKTVSCVSSASWSRWCGPANCTAPSAVRCLIRS